MKSIYKLLSALETGRSSLYVEPKSLVAYYWTGSIPKPNPVREIDIHDARIFAPDSFYLGTVLQIVFENQIEQPLSGTPNPHICAYGEVFRNEEDGFWVELKFGGAEALYSFRRFLYSLQPGKPSDKQPWPLSLSPRPDATA